MYLPFLSFLNRIFPHPFNYSSNYFFSIIIDRFSNLIVLYVIAINFTPELYGEITFLFAGGYVISTILDLGLNVFSQHRISSGYPIDFLNSLLFAKLILSIITVLIYFLFAIIYSKLGLFLLAIIGAYVLLRYFFAFFSYILFGKGKYEIIVKANLYFLVLTTANILLFLFVSKNVEVLLTLLSIAVFFQSVILFKEINIKAVLIDVKEIKSNIKESISLGLSGIFNLIYDRSDIILIGILLSFQEVGYYNAVYSFVKLSGIVLSAIMVPAFSEFSKTSAITEKLKKLKQYGIVTLLFSILIVIFYFFPGEYLFISLMGDKYEASLSVYKYLAMIVFITGMNNLTSTFINSTGDFKYIRNLSFYTVIISLTISMIFLPIIGLNGAVLSTFVTESLMLLGGVFYILKKFHFNIKNESH